MWRISDMWRILDFLLYVNVSSSIKLAAHGDREKNLGVLALGTR